jgi:hypothetical protein
LGHRERSRALDGGLVRGHVLRIQVGVHSAQASAAANIEHRHDRGHVSEVLVLERPVVVQALRQRRDGLQRQPWVRLHLAGSAGLLILTDFGKHFCTRVFN